MSIAIFPGNFQPFHIGHLLVVKGMVKSSSRVIIVVCTGDDTDQPFSKEEVQEMISSALLANDILDAEMIFVTDSEDDGEWIDKILEEAGNPEDPMIWSGNEDVLRIANELNIKTKEIKHAPGFVSEEIRQMIRNDNSAWKQKVPPAVANVIRKKV